jgi:DNA-binding Lrp family transcriptional regulator
LRIKDVAAGTGLRPPNVIRAIKRLKKDKLLDIISVDNKRGKKYRINFKYELSLKPDGKLSAEIKNVIPTDNRHYPYRQQKVIPTDNKNSYKSTTDVHLQKPKEIKKNIKKNTESNAEAKKEFKKDSFLAPLDHKLKTEAEMVAAAQRQKQALIEWEKANSSSEAIHE